MIPLILKRYIKYISQMILINYLPYTPIRRSDHKRSSNKIRDHIQYRNQRTLQQLHSTDGQTYDRNPSLFSRLKFRGELTNSWLILVLLYFWTWHVIIFLQILTNERYIYRSFWFQCCKNQIQHSFILFFGF